MFVNITQNIGYVCLLTSIFYTDESKDCRASGGEATSQETAHPWQGHQKEEGCTQIHRGLHASR